MVRWYDYVLAVFAADFMTGFLFWGFRASEWWEPIVAGLLAGLILDAWKTYYCKFRLRQEYGN
jgi:hypothetical protein